MLKQVRGALKGVGAWFIIALLVLAFALWGVPELRDFTQQTPLRVGDAGFSQRSILAEFNRQIANRRAQREGGYTREQAIAEGVPDLVINSIANRSILEQEAEKMGLVMPRALVKDYLQTDERFQNPATGRFDQFALQNILQANNLSVREFEELLKDDMLRSQLVDAVTIGGLAPKSLASALTLREVERRKIGYLTITEDMAGTPAEPTPDALQTYYEENKSAFTAPEFRTFTAVLLTYEDFSEGLETPEEDLRKLYESTRARYESPEKRTIYQITYDSEGEAQGAVAAFAPGQTV